MKNARKINIVEKEYESLIEEGAYDICRFTECKNITFLIEINIKYVKKVILSNLDLKEDSDQIKLLNNFLNKRVIEKNFSLCKQHLNETYNFIVEFFNSIESNVTKELDISNFKTQHLIAFSKFPFKNILDFFEFKINDLFCNKFYSGLFEDYDNLRKSIFETFLSQLNLTEKDLYASSYSNSEFIWFMDAYHYIAIPVYWQRNFILEKYIGKDSDQGKLHGPDFIFKDIRKNKTYGFEVVELNKLIFHSPKGFKDVNKFSENIFKQIKNRGGCFENYLKTIKLEVERKIEKWSKYQNTDYKYVGLILNNKIPSEWYLIFEILINSIYVTQKSVDGILFL